MHIAEGIVISGGLLFSKLTWKGTKIASGGFIEWLGQNNCRSPPLEWLSWKQPLSNLIFPTICVILKIGNIIILRSWEKQLLTHCWNERLLQIITEFRLRREAPAMVRASFTLFCYLIFSLIKILLFVTGKWNNPKQARRGW